MTRKRTRCTPLDLQRPIRIQQSCGTFIRVLRIPPIVRRPSIPEIRIGTMQSSTYV